MDIFLLYLMMQADAILGFFRFFCGFGFTVAAVIFLFGIMEENSSYNVTAKGIFILSVLFAGIAVTFPSTKTIAVMVGGHYAIEATKSNTAKKIMELVNRSLDKALADAVKK